MASPLAVHAQRNAMPVIGYLHFASPNYFPAPESFLLGLKDYGYVDGQNIALEYRWAQGEYDRLPAMAAELVARGVDLIAAFGPPPAKAAKNATSTIPIVFEVGNDAVEAGLVTSLAQPGGNATGLSILFVQVTAKRLELLCELLPDAKAIGLLVNPKSPTAEPSMRGAAAAARAKCAIVGFQCVDGIGDRSSIFHRGRQGPGHDCVGRSILRHAARTAGGGRRAGKTPQHLF